MKRIILFLFIVSTARISVAQESTTAKPLDPAFVRIMETNIHALDTASSNDSKMQIANNFERIANTAKTQWQPFYYAGLCYTGMALQVKDKSLTDNLADKAEAFLNKAEALAPGNSEVSTVQGMVANARILVDPPGRYRELGVVAATWFSKAHEQDPTNPRPYFVEARTKMFTPAMLGGGADAALPILETAIKKFSAFQPANSIAPNWGGKDAEKLMAQLKK